MFGIEDKTYEELRKKSVDKWLEDLTGHGDIEVRGGVKVTRDYIADLKKQIQLLESKGQLKDKYLKKLKASK